MTSKTRSAFHIVEDKKKTEIGYKIMKKYGFERGRCNEIFCDIISFYVKKKKSTRKKLLGGGGAWP